MKRVIVFLGLSFAAALCGITPLDAFAVTSWTSDPPVVTSNQPVMTGGDGWCAGYVQDRVIAELGTDNKVCLFGDDYRQFGYFSAGGSYQAVVQFPLSNQLHLLEGVCGGVVCHYSAVTDKLVTLQQVGAYSKGLVVYAHASGRVRKIQVDGLPARYSFDTASPDYEIKNSSGRYISTPSFGVSRSGKWVVAELYNAGLAIINTETFAARQIATNGRMYGYGMDPNEQLSVSDDGKSIAVTGINAGFSVIDIVPECGQDLIGDLSLQPSKLQCMASDLSIGGLFPNFTSAERPNFYGAGQQLEITVNNWVEASRRITFLAHGATATHKLKLLALGDSFTSGEGETNDDFYQPGTNVGYDSCHVSRRSYPLLIATVIGINANDAKTVACSGARTADIIGSLAKYWGQGKRLALSGRELSLSEKDTVQEEALNNFQQGRTLQSAFLEKYEPEKVLIGIGGNDAGLMGKLRTCAMPGTCEWVSSEGRKATRAEIERLSETLGSLFSQITRSNDAAAIYVVGYPNIIDANGSCGPVTNLLLDHSERLFIEESIKYLNRIINGAAKKAGFTYLGIENSLDTKRLCRGANSTAVNGLRLGDDVAITSALPMLKVIGAETFHPTPTGHNLIADAILAGHPGLRQDATCATDPMACTVIIPGLEPPAYWNVPSGVGGPVSYAVDFAAASPVDPYQMAIDLPEAIFEPGASVRVEIRSDPQLLGRYAVNQVGGVNGSISIPRDTEPGSHTLHMLGVNREGLDVDIYQFITIDRPDTVNAATGVDNKNSNIIGIANSIKREFRTSLLRSAVGMGLAGVLGANGGESITSRTDGSTPPHTLASVPGRIEAITAENRLWLIIVGCGALFLAAIGTILSRRRWAKPSS